MNSSIINVMYYHILQGLIKYGHSSSPRDRGTRELLCQKLAIDMSTPVITCPERELDYNFMVSEAYWILTGQRLLNGHVRKNLSKYSDGYDIMAGAYGPPFLQQVLYVVETLQRDPESRQAVLTLWERNPRHSSDIPCTLSMQFLARRPFLHTVVNMRSSDAWLGLPYDIFTFTMMSLFVNSMLQHKLKLGCLYLTAGSQHLYDRNIEAALKVREGGQNMLLSKHNYSTPDDLLVTLASCRDIEDYHKWPLLCQ